MSIKLGQNFKPHNIGSGENAVDANGLIAAGVGVLGDTLTNLSDNYQNTGDEYEDILIKGIYGDASQGNFSQIADNITGKSKENALNAINSTIYRNTGVSSLQDIANSYSTLQSPINIGKRGGLSVAGDILGSTLKGAASGFTVGSAIPGIGNIVGGIGGAAIGLLGSIGASINGNNRKQIDNAQKLAYTQTLNNLSTQTNNTTKQLGIQNMANAKYGGYINKYDLGGSLGDFNEINAGGTHEQNPYGGVLVNPNASVEQDEVIVTTQDGEKYVFSADKKMELTKEQANKYKQFGVKEGDTPADAAKKIRKEYEERLNDPISKRGYNKYESLLIQDSEENKYILEQKKLKEAILQKNIDPNALQQMSEEQNSQDQMLMQGINSNMVQNAFGGPIKYMKEGGNPNGSYNSSPWFIQDYPLMSNMSASNNIFTPIVTIDPEISGNKLVTPTGVMDADEKLKKDIDYIKQPKKERQKNINNNTFDLENLRYAPIIGNAMALAQNLFIPEDYSIPNRLQKEINALPRVSAPRVGTYLTYNPIDTNSKVNQVQAQNAANINAIRNTSNPAQQANLMAAMYNANIGYGDLVQAIEAQNAKERNAVKQYNNSLDQANAQAQMQAAGINQGYEQMRINGIMQELAMREAIQNARQTAISSNLSAITEGLAGIGKEAYNRNSMYDYMTNNKDYTLSVEDYAKFMPKVNTKEEFSKYYSARGANTTQIDKLWEQYQTLIGG